MSSIPDVDETRKQLSQALLEAACWCAGLADLIDDEDIGFWDIKAAELRDLAELACPSGEEWGGQNVVPINKARRWRG